VRPDATTGARIKGGGTQLHFPHPAAFIQYSGSVGTIQALLSNDENRNKFCVYHAARQPGGSVLNDQVVATTPSLC
jgi:hypothetical protein